MDMHYQPVGVATATLPDVFEAKLVFLSMLAECHSAQGENFCRGFRWMDIDTESDQVP